jgi:cupin 2 domain-containing protein
VDVCRGIIVYAFARKFHELNFSPPEIFPPPKHGLVGDQPVVYDSTMKSPQVIPLLGDLPDAGAAEVFQPLLNRSGVRIERIVSGGQASPPRFWYDQPHHEWVVLLRGAARLRTESPETIHALGVGDALFLPAGCRHRVDWTAPNEDTVWLAVHWDESRRDQGDSDEQRQ